MRLSRLGTFWSKCLDTFWPERCAGCGKYAELSRYGFCQTCQSTIVFWHNQPDSTLLHGARYEGVVKNIILNYKYQRKKFLAPKLANLLADTLAGKITTSFPEAIIPVPLFWWRELVRGFNQMVLIGLYLEKLLGIPLLGNVLIKPRPTLSQVGLDGPARKKNIQGSFRISFPAKIRDKHLLLIDDVYTTGATVSAAADCLKSAGARKVTICTIARA